MVAQDPRLSTARNSSKPYTSGGAWHHGIGRSGLFQTGRSECESDNEQKNARDNDAEEISIHRPQADRVPFVPCARVSYPDLSITLLNAEV